MSERLTRFLRTKVRAAGKEYENARRAYQNARAARVANLPTDDEGRARIVCRRYVERRAITFDAEGIPTCFDPDSPDCQGCVEDIEDGRIETW